MHLNNLGHKVWWLIKLVKQKLRNMRHAKCAIKILPRCSRPIQSSLRPEALEQQQSKDGHRFSSSDAISQQQLVRCIMLTCKVLCVCGVHRSHARSWRLACAHGSKCGDTHIVD